MPADLESYSAVKLNKILSSLYASVQNGKGSIQLHGTEVWDTASHLYKLLAIILQANIS